MSNNDDKEKEILKKDNEEVSSNLPVGKLHDMASLLKDTFQLFKKKILGSFGIMLWPMIIVAAIIAVIAGLFFVLGPSLGKPTTEFIVVISIVLGILFLYLSFWSQVSLLYYVSSNELSMVNSWKESKKSFKDYLWTVGLVSLVVCGGASLFLIPSIFLLFLLNGPYTFVIGIAGGILASVAMIIVSTYIIFTPFIFVVEKVGGMNALLRSYAYVKGRFASTFLRILAMSIIGVGIEIVISSILNNKIGDLLIFIVVTPLFLSYFYCLYLSAKSSAKDNSYDERKRKLFRWLAIFAVIGVIALCFMTAYMFYNFMKIFI